MTYGRRSGSTLVDVVIGAASGLVATWAMSRVQGPIMKVGGEATRRREQEAQGDLEPATVQVAKRAARVAGRSVPEHRTAAAGELVHYLVGTTFGAVFGLLAPRLRLSPLAAGPLYGAAVWLLNDEALVPALGLSRGPWRYPASSHAKALASHLVYGAATGAGYVALGRVVH